MGLGRRLGYLHFKPDVKANVLSFLPSMLCNIHEAVLCILEVLFPKRKFNIPKQDVTTSIEATSKRTFFARVPTAWYFQVHLLCMGPNSMVLPSAPSLHGSQQYGTSKRTFFARVPTVWYFQVHLLCMGPNSMVLPRASSLHGSQQFDTFKRTLVT